MKVYRIKNWESHYENNRTKAMVEMRWVPIPNKHDGDGYTELVSDPEGAALLGCWLVIVQVASKCRVRGTLLRDNGTPHTATSISRQSRLPEVLIQRCLDKASSSEIGWIDVVEVVDHEELAGDCSDNVRKVPDSGRQPTIEGNGREWKGMEAEPHPSEPSKGGIRTAPTLEQAVEYFRRMEADYSEAEIKIGWNSFEGTAVKGQWFFGKRPVTDWRAILETRLAENRMRNGSKQQKKRVGPNI